MNRNRRGGRDRDVGRRGHGGHDGLLGEGPGGGGGGAPGMGGGMMDPVMSTQMNQLMLAQQLLQKQAALNAGFGGPGAGGDLSALAGAMNNMQRMHQQQQHLQRAMGGGTGFSRGGDHRRNGKRMSSMSDREMDHKRQRRDSFGRSGDHDRFHGRDGNRGGENRDRVRSSRWEPVDDRSKNHGKKSDDYDPAEPTEDEDVGNKDNNLFCHVCSVSVYDDASFRRHLNGTKHQARMNSVLSVHQMKSSQLQSRLKAEEHLRKIEGKTGGFDPDYFCKICNNELTIPWDKHRFSNIHKQRQLQVKRGCGWCGVHDFNNFTDVLEHRETDGHRKNAEIYGKKNDDSSSEDKKSEKSRSGSSRDKKENQKVKEEEVEEDLTIPEYDPQTPLGQSYIVPVTGFFCKLCHKFYNNEKSAKGSHCQSEAHYQNFKAAMEAKIAAREAKRKEREAAAEAEAEQEQIKNENGEAEDKEVEEQNDSTALDEVAKEEIKEAQEDEDYDDELPINDSDDEGGLVKLIAESKDEIELPNLPNDESPLDMEESLLNETSANDSFTFLTGPMAEATLELQKQVMEDRKAETITTAETVDSFEDPIERNEAASEEEAPQKEEVAVKDEDPEDDIVTDMLQLSQESSQEETIPAVEDQVAPTGKPSRGRSTARRGRGRARAKK